LPACAWAVLAASLLVVPASAQEATRATVEPSPPTGLSDAEVEEIERAYLEEHPYGRLVLQLSPDALITADSRIDDGILRINISQQRELIGPQITNSLSPALLSYSIVPISAHAMRLDLRLATGVRGVSILRRNETRMEINFEEHKFLGQAVQIAERKARETAARPEDSWKDGPLAVLLAEPGFKSLPWVQWQGIYLPVGASSPVRVLMPLEIRPYPFGTVPLEVEQAWKRKSLIKEAVMLAELGEVAQAGGSLTGLPAERDSSRALVALARGYVWSRTGEGSEPVHPGRAADAYILAAGLMPKASWAPWARGQAAYLLCRDRRFVESMMHARKAIEAGPESPDRPYWELTRAFSQIQLGKINEGMMAAVKVINGVPAEDSRSRFEARRIVAHALWLAGEYARASQVADLVLAETPIAAHKPDWDHLWSRIYLDANRPARALPFLERIEESATRRVDRIRARWWLHEASLAHRDMDGARIWLRDLIHKTPGSTLVPLARVRLRLLDLMAVEDQEGQDRLNRQNVALELRADALMYPHTVVEDEALSSAAQLFVALGLLEDGLNLYLWIQKRTPTIGGAIAYEEVVCDSAPKLFDFLRNQGHVTRALGIYRGFLDDARMHACVDPQTRSDAAAAAQAAGLPDLAAKWLGQAVAEGVARTDAAENLVQLAAIYLEEGKVQSAAKTLDYLESAQMESSSLRTSSVRADVLAAQGNYKDAISSYTRAIARSRKSVRTRAAVPSLTYRRGLAAEKAGNVAQALTDTYAGAALGGAADPVAGWFRVASLASRLGRTADDWKIVLRACDEIQRSFEDSGVDEGQRSRGLLWHRSQAQFRLGDVEQSRAGLQSLATGTDTWSLSARQLLNAPAFRERAEALMVRPSDQ
jgi:tetratricopeptide (TPR) repeat protein